MRGQLLGSVQMVVAQNAAGVRGASSASTTGTTSPKVSRATPDVVNQHPKTDLCDVCSEAASNRP